MHCQENRRVALEEFQRMQSHFKLGWTGKEAELQVWVSWHEERHTFLNVKWGLVMPKGKWK